MRLNITGSVPGVGRIMKKIENKKPGVLFFMDFLGCLLFISLAILSIEGSFWSVFQPCCSATSSVLVTIRVQDIRSVSRQCLIFTTPAQATRNATRAAGLSRRNHEEDLA